MNSNLLYATLFESSIVEMPILDFWLGKYGSLLETYVSKTEWEKMVSDGTFFEKIKNEKILYIPEDMNIFELFDLMFLSISYDYNSDIPSDHPIHVFAEKIFDFSLQFILQSTKIIKINNRYITRNEMKEWVRKSQSKLSQECLRLFTNFEITRSKVTDILNKPTFTPNTFHDTLENFVYNFEYDVSKYKVQKFDIEHYRKIAFTGISLQKYDEALMDAKSGLEIDINDYELLVYTGECYYYKDEEEVAYSFFKKSLEINPKGSQAIGYLCVLDFPKTIYTGNDGELKVNELISKKMLKQALIGYEQDPNSYNLLVIIGKLYYNLQDYNKAAKFFEQLNRDYPGDSDNFELLISTYELSGNFNKLLQCLLEYLPEKHLDITLWNNIGVVFEKIGDSIFSQKFLYVSSKLQDVEFNSEVQDKNIIDQFLDEKDIFSLIRWLCSDISKKYK